MSSEGKAPLALPQLVLCDGHVHLTHGHLTHGQTAQGLGSLGSCVV